MKKLFNGIILLSLVVVLGACNNKPIEESKPEEDTSAVIEQSSEETPISSEEKPTSSETKPSSNKPSSSTASFIDNQLSTESGLVVYFKAQGARVDKITYGGKQIANDGFIVGRCANRIAGGKFTINGTQYQADLNDGKNSLHGGGSSWQGPFATANWTKVEQTSSSITYQISSADGANGYPGKMDMTVKYTLSQEGELSIEYSATTTKDTLCNPTNHLFIAINGETNRNYPNIKLQIDADKYTPLTNQLPTGEIASVEGTQFDYREEKAFDGSKNYDDNLVLNGEGYRKVAALTGTSLGLKVEVFTDRPGLQLYKDGNGSICLETQMFPDAINHENFENPILKAGETFSSKTTYAFSKVE